MGNQRKCAGWTTQWAERRFARRAPNFAQGLRARMEPDDSEKHEEMNKWCEIHEASRKSIENLKLSRSVEEFHRKHEIIKKFHKFLGNHKRSLKLMENQRKCEGWTTQWAERRFARRAPNLAQGLRARMEPNDSEKHEEMSKTVRSS